MAKSGPRLSNAYEFFILLLTVDSLGIMVVLLLPGLSSPTRALLQFYDNLICVIFLFDFAIRMPIRPTRTSRRAMWWSVVTLTTVGYGDFYPVTAAGRITAVVVMFVGVGIIASLASILASVLIPTPKTPSSLPDGPTATEALTQELAEIRGELAAVRASLGEGTSEGPSRF